MRDASNRDNHHPYRTLGVRLKRMREKRQETVAEVSGAVEIDVATLSEIERGAERPSEDILMLLMSHFAVRDDEAVKLWELAGYDYAMDPLAGDPKDGGIKQVMVLPMDARVIYTDMANIMVNNRGVVMNFMQEAGLGGQPLAVARIGMSREHAREVLNLLQKALREDAPKLLPAPEQKDNESSAGSSLK